MQKICFAICLHILFLSTNAVAQHLSELETNNAHILQLQNSSVQVILPDSIVQQIKNYALSNNIHKAIVEKHVFLIKCLFNPDISVADKKNYVAFIQYYTTDKQFPFYIIQPIINSLINEE